jgi:polysaccharide biosynthesis/export protein
MELRYTVFFALFFLLLCSSAGGDCYAQVSGKNNPYSPSPMGRQVYQRVDERTAVVRETKEIARSGPSNPLVSVAEASPVTRDQPERSAITMRTVADPTAEAPSGSATEIYKVGVGDVLMITLRGSTQSSNYFTVSADGTIDFPLARGPIKVQGLTPQQIERSLAAGITLFPNADVDVKVREYVSHKVEVKGAVERPGTKYLQREAMPLYVIKAEAGVTRSASRVVVTRSGRESLHDLANDQTDNMLVFPGDVLDFRDGQAMGFYVISGDGLSAGRKELTPGITLYQAVVIATMNSSKEPKKAAVRRRSETGQIATTEYDIRAIRDGKTVDPLIRAGDVIELRR